MNVDYIYCNVCGFEGFDIFVAYSRTCASGDIYICPSCNAETSHVDIN